MQHPLTPLARTMRWNPTQMERPLWHFLRQRPLGFKFRRQVPIDRYIVDFACLSARLVVEVDGAFHADQPADIEREEVLRARGWEVARYWNEDVRLRADNVLADIEQRLRALKESPTPGYRHPRPSWAGEQEGEGAAE